MKRARLLAVAAMLLVGMTAPAGAVAATLFVSTSMPASPLLGMSCSTPNYNTIQAAVGAAMTDDTIIVCDGVYREEVTVTKSLSLLGSGNAVIEIPGPATAGDDLVEFRGSIVADMSGFIVRGPLAGPVVCGGNVNAGIRVTDDATLELSSTQIRDIRNEPLAGCQNGEGIRVGTRGTEGRAGHLIADNVTVTRSQKTGINVNGTDSTAKITNTTVTGSGANAVIAQNGIQVSRGATATISTSTIRDHNYTPKTFVACGLIIFEAAGVNDDTNVYLNNEKDKCTFSGRGGTYEGAP